MYSVVLMAALTAGGQTPEWHGCSNCYNSYGACYGNYGIDTWGCGTYGNSYTCMGYVNGCSAYSWDWSSCGCNGCWNSCGVMSPYFVEQPMAPGVRTETVPSPKPAEVVPPKPESLAPTRGRLIVEVPADAKLYIDDHAMKTPSEHRTYQTPDLARDQAYYYEVRVEVERDGKMVSETKRVVVRAGQEAHADFNDMTATATAKAK